MESQSLESNLTPSLTLPARVNKYTPPPGHQPRKRQTICKRVRYYVSELGVVASSQLKQALLLIRNASDKMTSADLREAAGKQFVESQFLPATKELLCIWIHLEAVDQGGEAMPGWLMEYLKLALYATDYLIEQPPAVEIMEYHAHCQGLDSLYEDVGQTMAISLGFGTSAPAFAAALIPLMKNSRPARQQVLKDSLTLNLDQE
jgi:hypothetical protein